MAHSIALQRTEQLSTASAVGGNLLLIAPHTCNRRASAQNRKFPFRLRRLEGTVHPLNIRHRPSDLLLWNFQSKAVNRL